jgi:hypothetical protein
MEEVMRRWHLITIQEYALELPLAALRACWSQLNGPEKRSGMSGARFVLKLRASEGFSVGFWLRPLRGPRLSFF